MFIAYEGYPRHWATDSLAYIMRYATSPQIQVSNFIVLFWQLSEFLLQYRLSMCAHIPHVHTHTVQVFIHRRLLKYSIFWLLLLVTFAVPILSHDTYRSRESTSCLLYTSPSPRDATLSRMPSSA